jgi:hypothetical protein
MGQITTAGSESQPHWTKSATYWIWPLDQLGFVDFQKFNNFGQQNSMPAYSALFHITYGVANSAIILVLILVAKSFEGPSDFGLQTNSAGSSLASGWSHLLVQWR